MRVNIGLLERRLLLILLWAPLAAASIQIGKGLTLDETLTYFVSRGSYSDVLHAAAEYQGQSPLYYLLITTLIRHVGSAEGLLRLPSLIATIGSVVIFTRICRTLWSNAAAYCPAAIFAAMLPFLEWPLQARPYALSLFLALCAGYAFILWIRSNRAAWYAAWLACSVLAIECVFLAAPFVALLGCLLLGRKEKRRAYLLGAAAIAGIVGALSGAQLGRIAARGALYAFMPPPAWRDFAEQLFSAPVALPLLLVGSVYFAGKVLRKRQSPPAPFVVGAALGWWLLPPLLLFLVAKFDGAALFLSRYYFYAWPGYAVLLGASIAGLWPPARRAMLTLMLLLTTTASFRPAAESGFREVAALANRRCAGKAVLFQSGLIESADLRWLTQHREYLLGPLNYYTVAASSPVILLPVWLEAANETYWSEQVRSATGPDELCLIRRRLKDDQGNLEQLTTLLGAYRMSYQRAALRGEVELGLFHR